MSPLRSSLRQMAAVCLALVATASQAHLLSFGTGSSLRLPGYNEGDLRIESLSNVSLPDFAGIRDWNTFTGSVPQSLEGVGNGERELMLIGSVGNIRFSRASGAVFDLTGISIDDPRGAASWGFNGSVRITGSNGAFVDLNASAFGAHALADALRGLSWFSIQCNNFFDCQAALDDIVYVDAAPVANSIPIAGTLPMSLLALGLLRGLLARPRQALGQERATAAIDARRL